MQKFNDGKNLDIGLMQNVNGQYFNYFSNGGYGRLPLVSDDQRTTDELVARRIQYPSQKMIDRYDDTKHSSFYTNDQNRALTFSQQYGQLSQKGIKLVGEEGYGRYSTYANVPDPTGKISLYSTDSEISVMLWIVLIIGAISLVSNAIA